MEQLVDRCAGIDVGQAEVVVCARVPENGTGQPVELVATYGTTTPELLELHDWLAGMCPGQRDSAGKRGSGKTRKGSKWLRATLVQSARAATRTKNTYLRERYVQVRLRRGDPRAVVAVGHEILIAAYRVLETGQPYQDPGPARYSALTAQRQRHHALDQLQRLGYTVILERTATPA